MARRKADWRRAGFILLAAALLTAAVILTVLAVRARRDFEALAATTPVPTLAPPDLAFQAQTPLYRHGSIGPEVMELQRRLAELGFYGGEIDGKYFEGTQESVRLFQEQHGLDADGLAGALTLEMLFGPDARPRASQTPGLSASPSPSPPPGAYVSPSP